MPSQNAWGGGTSNRDDIYEDLFVAAYEDLEMVDYEVYSRKLASLIKALEINMSKLGEAIHISSSYLSKICAGQAKPRSPVYIAEGVADYVTSNYDKADDQITVQRLIWGSAGEGERLTSIESYNRHLKKWLLNGENAGSILIEHLLYRYEEFNKDTYLSYAKNLELATTTVKKDAKGMQLYTGLDGLADAVLSWIDAATNSKVNDEIFLFDEISLVIARSDYKVAYKWIVAIEKLIRTGKKIIHVHSLENDVYLTAKEMLMVLPLTMSNRVQHYFISEPKDNTYRNMLLVSSESVLSGSIVGDDFDSGCYMLIKSANDIKAARLRAKKIIEKAEMSHVLFENEAEFNADVKKNIEAMEEDDTLFVYLPIPAISTMEESLFKKLLKKNQISQELSEAALDAYHRERKFIDEFAQKFKMDVSVDYISEDRWDRIPPCIVIDDGDIDLKILYDRESYEEHIASTKSYGDQCSKMKMSIEGMNFFQNMVILFIPDKFAAAVLIGKKLTNTDTVKKPIVDSIEELMYDITPSNANEVQKNKKKTEILQFYKGLVG